MRNLMIVCSIVLGVVLLGLGCGQIKDKDEQTSNFTEIRTLEIPNSNFGEAVRYGKELMTRTAYFIGPKGIKGKYATNQISCNNCHQDGGLKPYSFNLTMSFVNYPSYRAREGKVLSLAERVNNCIMHPLIGSKPLPLDSKEMIAFLSYLKWINESSKANSSTFSVKNLEFSLPDTPASPKAGKILYANDCARCHGKNGEGAMASDTSSYIYPPLWGMKSYRAGSSMHRVVIMARWLLPNMPYDKATHEKPFLKPEEALDLAAFINDDSIHKRPPLEESQYPNISEKPVDYDRGPFIDSFSETQHKFDPYKPIVAFYKSKGLKVAY